MFESFVNKILFLIFFMALFNVVRHIWAVIRQLREEDGYMKGYELTKPDLLFLGLSLAYIASTLFVGIKI